LAIGAVTGWTAWRARLNVAWTRCRRWLRVAWVCRASVFSVLLGAALFCLSQTQDLFLDFAGIGRQDFLGNPGQDVWPPIRDGFGFALLIAVFWALPVHSVARLAVSDPAWLMSPYRVPIDATNDDAARRALQGPARMFQGPAKILPRALALCCFVIPFASAIHAWIELPIDRNLALAMRAETQIISALVFLIVCGAAFWFYMRDRRNWFNRDRHAHRVPAAPSVGAVDDEVRLAQSIDSRIALAILIILLLLLAFPGLIAEHFSRLWMVPLLLGIWIPVLGYLARRAHAMRAPAILAAILTLGAADYYLGDDHVIDVGNARIANPGDAGAPDRQVDLGEAVTVWSEANGCKGHADLCPSPIVVVTTGGASRAAFFTASVLGLLLDASCPDDFDPIARDVRLNNGQPCSKQPVFARQLFALSGVSGGSVGAAFFARALVDGRGKNGAYAPPCPRDSNVRSTLSFSVLHPVTWRECFQAMLAEDFLSPVVAGLGFRDVLAFVGGLFPRLWPDRGHRLEDALAQAYAKFTDPDGAAKPGFGLNGGFLEAAPVPGDNYWRPLLLLNSTSAEAGRRFVFSALRASSFDPPQQDARSRSVEWLTDAYDFHEEVDGSAGPPYRDVSLAVAMHNSARFPFISPAGTLYLSPFDPSPGGLDDPGLNAAHADGRYHSRTAEGTFASLFHAPAQAGRIFGRLVDGGYFDNYGVLTARDLVVALRKQELRPFIILITNDPINPPEINKPSDDWVAKPPAMPDAVSKLPASFVSAPLDAIVSTRSAHGSYGVMLLRKFIDPVLGDSRLADVAPSTGQDCLADTVRDLSVSEPCFVNIAVYAPSGAGIAGKVKDVSMSWWLSKPVQEYLDAQIQNKNRSIREQQEVGAGQMANGAALRSICRALWPSGAYARACIDNINHFSNYLAGP
jgi:hypothetical protein